MSFSSAQTGSICLVPLTNAVSGTERIVGDIAKALHEKGVQPIAVVPEGSPLDGFVASLREHAHIAPRIGPVSGRTAVGRNLWRALKIFAQLRPQIVHFHCPNYRWGLDVILAARLARVPTIIRTEHNPLMGNPGRAAGALLQLADAPVTLFTYVSQGNQDRYERLLPYRRGRGRVIANGIDPQRFTPNDALADRQALREALGFPRDALIAVHVGAYDERRSLRPIFKALQQLRADPATAEDAARWRLLVIGNRPEEEQRLARELHVDSVITFAGRRNDVNTLLPLCDLFVTASHYEGMSIAILEAWACGLPVLATRVDGIVDIVEREQEAAFTVPHGDTAAFAGAWLRFMREPAQMAQIHQVASRRVRASFTTDTMLASYLNLYNAQMRSLVANAF